MISTTVLFEPAFTHIWTPRVPFNPSVYLSTALNATWWSLSPPSRLCCCHFCFSWIAWHFTCLRLCARLSCWTPPGFCFPHSCCFSTKHCWEKIAQLHSFPPQVAVIRPRCAFTCSWCVSCKHFSQQAFRAFNFPLGPTSYLVDASWSPGNRCQQVWRSPLSLSIH